MALVDAELEPLIVHVQLHLPILVVYLQLHVYNANDSLYMYIVRTCTMCVYTSLCDVYRAGGVTVHLVHMYMTMCTCVASSLVDLYSHLLELYLFVLGVLFSPRSTLVYC